MPGENQAFGEEPDSRAVPAGESGPPAGDVANAQASATPSHAAATGAPCLAMRYVLVQHGPAALPTDLFERIAGELATELQERGLAVCERPDEHHGPAASVALSRVDAKHILVDIDDHATDKRISRNVSLAALPDDGHALAVAVAVDELLRASWAELLLRPSQNPQMPPGRGAGQHRDDDSVLRGERAPHVPPMPRAASPADEARAPAAWSVRAGGTYQYGAEHWNAFGAEVHGYRALSRPLRLGAFAHAYQSLRVRDPLGSVAGTGAGLGVSLGMCHDTPLHLCMDAQLAVDRLAFDALGGAGASARDRSDWPVLSSLALSAEWPSTGRIFGGLELTAGAALHGVEARAGERTVTGLAGAVLGVNIFAGARP
jgi:hypothetical protein